MARITDRSHRLHLPETVSERPGPSSLAARAPDIEATIAGARASNENETLIRRSCVLRIEPLRRITLVSEASYRVALTDSGIEDANGR